MAPTTHVLPLLFALLTPFVAAQQGVLVNGNSQLPACAQTCTLLNQAAQACNGITSGSQSAWICFCQSGYLTSLYDSDAGICDAFCTDATDSQQVSTWYKTNCGTDHGASEHPDSGAASSSSPAASTATSAAAGSSSTGSPGGSSSGSSGSNSQSSNQSGGWWSTHYKWIIMLIVLAILLPALGVALTYLKKWHDRRQDLMRGGFNAGITTRSAGGPSSNGNLNGSGFMAATPVDGSGRNSPARTRDAFMPYGYAYSHSESRLGSKQAVHEQHRGSPLARGGELDAEKQAAVAAGKQQSRRVLVRERSVQDADAIEAEKRPGGGSTF